MHFYLKHSDQGHLLETSLTPTKLLTKPKTRRPVDMVIEFVSELDYILHLVTLRPSSLKMTFFKIVPPIDGPFNGYYAPWSSYPAQIEMMFIH